MSERDIQKDDLVGKTKAIRDHDHDMIHDLSKRLDAVWRYDQYIENADKFPDLQRCQATGEIDPFTSLKLTPS